MAALIDSARSGRADARRLCAESRVLRTRVRTRARLSEARLARAREILADARARREVPCASPWSGLRWLREDESLERILLPID